MTARCVKFLIVVGLLALSGLAVGRSSDRNQPADIESDSHSGTFEANGVQRFMGNVTVNQGTLNIKAATADVTMVNNDIARVVLKGSPVTMTQQLDDGTPFTANASQIDYDLRTDTIVLIGNYTVTTPRGSSTGQRLSYNLKTGAVDSGGGSGGRVRMRINPRTPQG